MDSHTFAHNLNILLVDANNNIVLDNDFLDEIKTVLCQSNTRVVGNMKITIQWNKKELNNVEKHFMGDLFLNSIYSSDDVIINHTTQLISQIKNPFNYSVRFYIHKLVGSHQICGDSYGII